jgi:hypothetical protein
MSHVLHHVNQNKLIKKQFNHRKWWNMCWNEQMRTMNQSSDHECQGCYMDWRNQNLTKVWHASMEEGNEF